MTGFMAPPAGCSGRHASLAALASHALKGPLTRQLATALLSARLCG